MSEKQVEALLDAPDLDTPLGLRDRAMLETIYATGLRVSELVNLRLHEVSLADGVLRALGKGSKERLVPLGQLAIDWITRYLHEARPDILQRPAERRPVRHRPRRRHDPPGLLAADQALCAAGRHSPARNCRRTCCATPSPPTCSTTAPTCAWCSCCSATPTSRPRRSTPTSPASGSSRLHADASSARLEIPEELRAESTVLVLCAGFKMFISASATQTPHAEKASPKHLPEPTKN
jgi:hypothetical protein